MNDIPIATKSIYIINKCEDLFFFVILAKKQLEIYTFNTSSRSSTWELIFKSKILKIDDIIYVIQIPEKLKILFLTKNNENFILNLESFEISQIFIRNIENFNNYCKKNSTFNYQSIKSSVKFINVNSKNAISINNIFFYKKTEIHYYNSIFLKDVKIPLSRDRSLERRTKNKPLFLEDKPLISYVSK